MAYRQLRRITKRRLIIPLLRSRRSPEHAARGAAVGLALAMTPLIGIQMMLATACWVIYRLIGRKSGFSLPVALAYTWVSNVFTAIPIYYLFFATGRLLLGQWRDLVGLSAFAEEFRRLSTSGTQNLFEQVWTFTVQLFESFGIPLFLGCLPWMAISAWFGYTYTLGLIRRRNERREQKRKNTSSVTTESETDSQVA